MKARINVACIIALLALLGATAWELSFVATAYTYWILSILLLVFAPLFTEP